MAGVTAVVVTFNSAEVVGACLDALATHARGVPVVVVDNGSGDGTQDLVAGRAPAVELVRSLRNGGYAAGINLAARHAPGDDLLVLNPDTRICAGTLDVLVDALAVPCIGIAVPRLIQPDGSTAYSQRRAPTVGRALGEAILGGERAGRFGALGELVVDPALYATPTVVDWASGAAMLVDRRCHDALGGWDESFFLYAEESDLCLRAADHGWRTLYAPGAVVHHDGGHGERTPLRELMMVNKAVLYGRRHGPLPTVAYRSALVLQEGLRAWRGPYQRAAFWRLLGRPSRLRLPPPSVPHGGLERPRRDVRGDDGPHLKDSLPRHVGGRQRQGGPGPTVGSRGDEGGDHVEADEADEHPVGDDERAGAGDGGQRGPGGQQSDGDGQGRRGQVHRRFDRRRRPGP